jgi:hypothetical protein
MPLPAGGAAASLHQENTTNACICTADVTLLDEYSRNMLCMGIYSARHPVTTSLDGSQRA